MNKTELIAKIAANTSKPQTEVAPIVNNLFDVIKDRMYQEEDVKIADFGAFTVKSRAARTGRNPQTGLPVEIAAKQACAFKPAKALKDYIQNT